MVQYIEAIKKPFENKKTLAIATVLGLVPILSFFVTGFVMRAAKSSMFGSMNLPAWKNYKDLFFLGLKTFAIIFIYFLPILAVQSLFLKKYILFIFYGVYFEMTSFMINSLFFSIAYFLLILLFLPAALSSFLYTEKIKDAFKIGRFYNVLLSGQYWFSILVVVLFALGLSFVIGLINLIAEILYPQISFLIVLVTTSFFNFAVFLVAMIIFAQTYGDITNQLEGKI